VPALDPIDSRNLDCTRRCEVSVTKFDGWLLRRLDSVDEPATDTLLARASETNRPLAELLSRMPFAKRGDALDANLTGRADRDAIEQAMEGADPMAAPPAADEAPPTSGWPPLRLTGLPPVEPFPVDVLPDPAARLVIEGADAIGCPRDFLGVPILAVAGGTIGRSASLMLKHGYFTSTTIFAAPIGPPSDGKTPGLKAVAAPVRAISDQLAAEHARAQERWREDNASVPRGTKPPPQPKPSRIDIDDATMEVLPIILADNPR
jgi:Protein of unknown function (DUF3987)